MVRSIKKINSSTVQGLSLIKEIEILHLMFHAYIQFDQLKLLDGLALVNQTVALITFYKGQQSQAI